MSVRLARLLFALAALTASACQRGGSSSRHPLDPLTTNEIERARSVLQRHGLLGGERRVSTIDLLEPPKPDVLAGRLTARRAFVVLYDPAKNTTTEATVNVDDRTLEATRDVPGVEPRLDAVDADVAESVTRASEAWRKALDRRGLSSREVTVSAWSAGNFGPESPARGRLVRALTFVRANSANEMSRPVEDLVVLVDVAAKRVVNVYDAGTAPVPSAASERDAWRALPRAATQSPPAPSSDESGIRGAGIGVSGHAVSWRRWRLHVALRPREGLVLYGVGFDDGSGVRSILYHASLSEMVVPYGDPSPSWYFRNTFDVGELGVGTAVTPLVPGVDCPRGAVFIDAAFADPSGGARRVPRSIALYERDGGLAWKHGSQGARARELVVLSISRLGNYDYGFEWTFHEDGTISHRVLLTGVMAPKAEAASAADSLAEMVAPGVAAVLHQHFFNYRLDLDVDGASPNRVDEVETNPLAAGPSNAQGGGFAEHRRPFATEADAMSSQTASVAWLVTSGSKRNGLGQPTGYELVPGSGVRALADSSSVIRRRAGFLAAPLWVTPFADSERWSAGEYPNQSAGGDGLPTWTRANRPVRDTDVVLWYTVGVTHNPRPEDWPVMPVHSAGFMLVPVGFFDRNPMLGAR